MVDIRHNISKKLGVGSDFHLEMKRLSLDFDETFDEWQHMIERYNQLLEITQHVVLEINQMIGYQNNLESDKLTENQWQTYFFKIKNSLEVCQAMGEAVDAGKSMNEMIGYYLLGAKKEAAEIIIQAEKREYDDNDKLKKLQQTVQSQEQLLAKYEQRFSHNNVPIVSSQEQLLKLDLAKERVSEMENYAVKIKQDADRYSRQRKLLIDDQVNLSKREIAAYAEQREQEIEEAEARLAELTKRLQERMESQVNGALGSITEYAQREGISLEDIIGTNL